VSHTWHFLGDTIRVFTPAIALVSDFVNHDTAAKLFAYRIPLIYDPSALSLFQMRAKPRRFTLKPLRDNALGCFAELSISLGGASGPLEVLIALLPSVLVMTAVLCAIVIFPWRKGAHLILRQFLFRLAANPRAPLLSLAALLTFMAALTGLIAHLVQP
jgi:hypothetical protein